MRKKLIITAVLASVMVMCFAQKPHKIMFYNMENFFDTIDDPETNDEEFLPDGAKRWNTAKYDKKLRNMERVLFDIAAIDRNYPAVIGVSEIENRSILEDIASTRKLLPARYAICHYDSPTCAAWTWRSSTVRMSSNSKAAPTSPCGSPRCPTGAHAAS